MLKTVKFLLVAPLVFALACAPLPDTATTPPVIDTGNRSPVAYPGSQTAGAPASTVTEPAATRTIPRGREEARIGAEQHMQILAAFGGESDDPDLRAYVDRIGRDLARRSEQPAEFWRFTVLDSPEINAFALPGGYVYVTRGLLALADDEAEVAGVVGHEIGHVTLRHNASRQERRSEATLGVLGAILVGGLLGGEEGARLGQDLGSVLAGGSVARYSRGQEFEADRAGIRYLAAAGYDPYAQADFLLSMQERAELDAALVGRAYDPNRVSFFASHPATGERVREARQLAATVDRPGVTIQRDRGEHLAAIDGMLFGDNPEQGVIRDGGRYIHPVLGFAFTAPQSWRIDNRPDFVGVAGPGGARMILDAGSDPGGSLAAFVGERWLPAIARDYGAGQPSAVRTERVNGLETARAAIPVRIDGGLLVADLVAIRHGGLIYRFSALTPDGATGLRREALGAIATFSEPTRADLRLAEPERLVIRTVQRGDTIDSLAALMVPGPLARERFMVLNSLDPGDRVAPGDRVKIVVR
ncbi:MAG: M48 family metalloprotease [Rubricella sp.]